MFRENRNSVVGEMQLSVNEGAFKYSLPWAKHLPPPHPPDVLLDTYQELRTRVIGSLSNNLSKFAYLGPTQFQPSLRC